MKRVPWLEWEQVTETPYPMEKEMILQDPTPQKKAAQLSQSSSRGNTTVKQSLFIDEEVVK
jgi:hypothetical protein